MEKTAYMPGMPGYNYYTGPSMLRNPAAMAGNNTNALAAYASMKKKKKENVT